MTAARILIVEDETAMRRALHDGLAREGFRILVAVNGEEGLNLAIKERPDLLLIDVMMPRLDGFALCREIRRIGLTMPILFLSARTGVDDRVRGLNDGGDDYLAKPFCRAELLARVHALLRRSRSEGEAVVALRLGTALIHFQEHRAKNNGKAIALSRKEFGMMHLLAQRQGQVVSRQEFLDVVWGYTAFPTTRTVDRHIVGLRQKFEPCPEEPRYILTVHGCGYRLEDGEALSGELLQKANN